MEKEKFKKYMLELVSLKKDEDALNKVFRKFEPDFNHIGFGRYETLVVRVLEEAVFDTSNWISYWLYDLDCGTLWKKGKVKTKEGKDVPLKTIDNLYNCIINKN